MATKRKTADPLVDLLQAAKPETLIKLIVDLAKESPEVRRACFDFLKRQVSLTADQKRRSEGEAVMSLWWEVYPDLDELYDYGGGDYGTEDHVSDLLYDIQQRLAGKRINEQVRRKLLDEVLPFIDRPNAGLEDALYDLAYSTCYSDEDWRLFAGQLESMDRDWPVQHARQIYRKLGDRVEYLELRRRKLVYGDDYHDLALFYWEEGSQEEALKVAEEGVAKGQGRMDGLRKFLSDRAREGGDRDRYLALQFEQASDRLTLDKYNAFKKVCTAREWQAYEPKLLESLDRTWESERLKIRMKRKEYDQALAILQKDKYPHLTWNTGENLKFAKQLEPRFPEQILAYYLSGLGNLNRNATRKEYAERARTMLKVRHLLLEVLKDGSRWKKFATLVKRDNLRRPAFQEEFAATIPDWLELV